MSVLNWYVNRPRVRAVHLGVSDASMPRTSLGGDGSTNLDFQIPKKFLVALLDIKTILLIQVAQRTELIHTATYGSLALKPSVWMRAVLHQMPLDATDGLFTD